MTPLCRKAKNSIGLQVFKAKYGRPAIVNKTIFLNHSEQKHYTFIQGITPYPLVTLIKIAV